LLQQGGLNKEVAQVTEKYVMIKGCAASEDLNNITQDMTDF